MYPLPRTHTHTQNNRLLSSFRKCIKKQFDLQFFCLFAVCCLLLAQFPNFLQHSSWMDRFNRLIKNDCVLFVFWSSYWFYCIFFFSHFLNHFCKIELWITYEIYHQNRMATNSKSKQKTTSLTGLIKSNISIFMRMEWMVGKNIYWILNVINNNIILLPDWCWFSTIIIRSTLDTKRFNYCGISQFRKAKDLIKTKWK